MTPKKQDIIVFQYKTNKKIEVKKKVPKEAQTLNLIDINFKKAIINMYKN